MKGSLKKGITASHWIFILSLLNSCLVVASLISFLGPEGQAAILAPKIANFIFSHYSWWVILPPIILIVASWGASEKTTSKKTSFRTPYRRRR